MGCLLREHCLGQCLNRFRDDRVVLAFHKIFVLRDASQLELPFHVFAWPVIREI